MSRSRATTLFSAALLAITGLAAQAQDSAAVTVDDAYARAVPPGQANSAVFMTLTNGSDQARALTQAASPVAENVELHTHTEEGGMMRMRRVERIDIPAGDSVALKPGGHHIMLIGLKGDLEPGGTVELTLTFDDGSDIQVQAPIRKVEAMHMKH